MSNIPRHTLIHNNLVFSLLLIVMMDMHDKVVKRRSRGERKKNGVSTTGPPMGLISEDGVVFEAEPPMGQHIHYSFNILYLPRC